jgi:hypothetical protein
MTCTFCQTNEATEKCVATRKPVCHECQKDTLKLFPEKAADLAKEGIHCDPEQIIEPAEKRIRVNQILAHELKGLGVQCDLAGVNLLNKEMTYLVTETDFNRYYRLKDGKAVRKRRKK